MGYTSGRRRLLPSRHGSVVEVNHAVAETAFVQQLELHADIVGEGRCAASHHHGHDEQVELIDQANFDRLGGEVGTANGDVMRLVNRSAPL
jgi:hypothetical protein